MSDGEVGSGRGSGRPSELLRPFQIRVTDRELDALRARLVNAARLPELPGRPGEYGGSAASVQALVDYWRDGYDWPAWEARLNEHRHYVTTIDGTAVHFLHVRSPEPDALPLLLTHGWPGTVAELLDLVGPLSGFLHLPAVAAAGNGALAMELADRLEAHSRELGLTRYDARSDAGCLSQR